MFEPAAGQVPLAIVTPVYNDWDSLGHMLADLDEQAEALGLDIHVVVVDDGSTERCPETFAGGLAPRHLRSVELLELTANLGHQRALALGLSHTAARGGFGAVLLMDADGEDRPSDIARLLAAHRETPDQIIVAGRGKRSEGPVFKAFYAIYRVAFRLMTGKSINFGNFMLIPGPLLRRMTLLGDLWNNIAATVVKSRLPTTTVATERGTRYRGVSKMNFTMLVIHGMSAISVFIDVLLARMLLVSLLIMGLALVGMGVVVGMRFLTDLAIPGWATSAFGILAVIVAQMVLLAMVSMLSFLNSRSQRPLQPAAIIGDFVGRRLMLFERERSPAVSVVSS